MTFPGPESLGRGIVIPPGADVPSPLAGVPRVRVDYDVLAQPEAALAVLGQRWAGRRRVVVELAVTADDLRVPEVCTLEPWRLTPDFTFARERLHFLVWANTYDARSGDPVWWHGVRATRLGARASPAGPADVTLSDGRPAWCDGGPRQPVALGGGEALVHRDSIDAGRLTPARFAPPTAPLAPDQLAAVAHHGGPARIIAPAGSGKTRVLTERVRHLLADRGYEPDLVTAVAYNVLAAAELRERLADIERPTIRTLNSLGLAVCQRRGRFRVVEEPERRQVLDGVLAAVGSRRPGRRLVGTDPLAPYFDALSAVRLGLLSPRAAEAAYPDAAGLPAVFPAYRERLAANGLLDFDEQIYRAVELLLGDPALRAEVRARARTLLVDEFQDLTPAHVLLVRLVAGPAADVFGVGDDDQVIYGYAGADPGFLIDFGSYFPGAAIYDLTVNYRCPPEIVRAAATLLTHNRRRLDKTIRAGPGREASPGSVSVRAAPGTALAPIAVEVVRGWTECGTEPSAVAVLTRVNSTLLPVQVLLTEAGIPCQTAVGLWILDRAGTAAALAYLRMGAEPAQITAADVRATVRRPSRGLSPKAIDLLTRDQTTSLRSVRGLAEWMANKSTFQRDSDKVALYAADLDAVATALAAKATTVEVLALIREDIGLGQALSTLDASKGTLDRSAYGDDLAALEQVAALHPDPDTFEVWLREMLGRGGGSGAREEAAGVRLATVHRVKGREWPKVLILGADAGLLPHRLAADVEEERRIFHVALTRAREAVVVLADEASPSPFLNELTHAAPTGGVPEAANPAKRATTAFTAARPPAPGRPLSGTESLPAEVGSEVTLADGRAARVTEVRRGGALVATGGQQVEVDFGTEVRVGAGRQRQRLIAPPRRVEANAAALALWRSARAKAEGKPAYVFLANSHAQDIAERDPDTLTGLARCQGIGRARLESYGDEILRVLAEAEA